MGIHSLVVGLVVIGRDGQQKIRAHVAVSFGERNSLPRVKGAAADNYRRPALELFYGALDYHVFFLPRERGRFARRTDENDALDAFLYLTFDKKFRFFRVNLAAFKRRDQSRVNSLFHKFSFSTKIVGAEISVVNETRFARNPDVSVFLVHFRVSALRAYLGG